MPLWLQVPLGFGAISAFIFVLSKVSGTWDDEDNIGGYRP